MDLLINYLENLNTIPRTKKRAKMFDKFLVKFAFISFIFLLAKVGAEMLVRYLMGP